MHKKILLSAVAVIAFLGLSATAQAVTCASEDGGPVLNGSCTVEPNNFIQTLNSMRLVRANGDGTYSFVTTATAAATYDFASVAAGGNLGNFMSGEEIPAGTYVVMSPILDKMATLNADVNVDGLDCRTDAAVFNTGGGAGQDYTFDFTAGGPFAAGTDAAYDFDTAANEEEWLNADGDLVIVKKFPAPISISADGSSDITISMAVDSGEAADFHFDGVSCTNVFLGALGVTFTVADN